MKSRIFRELASLPDRICLPLDLDLAGIAEEVAAFPDASWTAHFVPQHFQGQWDVVPLRAPAGAAHPIQRIAPNPGIVDWCETEELVQSPLLRAKLHGFLCPLGAARLMRLRPGSVIHEHCDPGLDACEGSARLHIPIATGPGVDFRLNGTQVVMAVGECWYLRLQDRHSVRNEGTTDRIHLVIDATVNDWLTELLLRTT